MNLDITTTMVLVKGQDKTEQISWLKHDRKNQRVEVQYKSNITIYKYSSQNIKVLNKLKSINIEHCLVNIKGVPAYKVTKVLNFDTLHRIIYEIFMICVFMQKNENNPKQLNRDRLKNSILEKYKIPLLRLPTNHSGEEEKIKKKLDELL